MKECKRTYLWEEYELCVNEKTMNDILKCQVLKQWYFYFCILCLFINSK